MTRRLLPLGVFALAVVGAHLAADRLDDHLFSLLHLLDRLFDQAAAAAVRGFGGLFGVPPARTEAWTEVLLELVDLDAKLRWSVHLAIAFELLADALLLLALLGPGTREADHGERRAAGQALTRDPTLLRVASPLAVSLLTLVGALVMARAVHAGATELLAGLGLGGLGARFLVRAAVALALGLGLVFLLPRAWSRPLVRAHRFAARDHERGRTGGRLRLRGLGTALVLVPVALIAGRELARLLHQLAGGLSS